MNIRHKHMRLHPKIPVSIENFAEKMTCICRY